MRGLITRVFSAGLLAVARTSVFHAFEPSGTFNTSLWHEDIGRAFDLLLVECTSNEEGSKPSNPPFLRQEVGVSAKNLGSPTF